MQWGFSKDTIGQHMIAAVSAANKLRNKYAVLRKGWANILHEDRPNGVSRTEMRTEHKPPSPGGPSTMKEPMKSKLFIT